MSTSGGRRRSEELGGKAEGRETEMVRACEEKGRKLHRQKNNEN